MQVKIRNFRGCKQADFNINKTVTIAGKNHQGKTSIKQGVAACLTNNPIVIEKLTKKQISKLVHSGTAAASVAVSKDKDNYISIDYPEAKTTSKGITPVASEYATGIKTILNKNKSERIDVLNEYLKALPTKEDLYNKIKSCKINPDSIIDRLWDTIEIQGWEGAHALVKEKSTKLKGQWEEITQERFGKNKINSWLPAEWSSDLEDKKESDLIELVKQEKGWLESAIACNAVSQSEADKLTESAEKYKTLFDEKNELKTNLESLRKLVVEKSEIIKQNTIDILECPNCKEKLLLDNDILIKNEVKKTIDITDTRNELEKVLIKKTSIESKLAHLRVDLNISENAIEELKGKKIRNDDSEKSAVEDCRNRIEKAETELKAFQAFHSSKKISNVINVNAKLIDIMNPKGLRQEKLIENLEVFNSDLKKLCKIAGWENVEILDDMSITYNGAFVGDSQHTSLCSESEYHMTFITLQAAFAWREDAQCILIDGADVFDNDHRSGLMHLMKTIDKNCIVFMKAEKKDLKDLDNCFWIEGGILEEYNN